MNLQDELIAGLLVAASARVSAPRSLLALRREHLPIAKPYR